MPRRGIRGRGLGSSVKESAVRRLAVRATTRGWRYNMPDHPRYSYGNIATTFLLRHPARRRSSERGLRQHAFPEATGLQIAQRETEYRLDRRRRQGFERYPRLRPDREYRGAVRCG